MGYKIAISKSGFNVLTETNPDNLIFSSDYNTLKYYVSGSGSVTITASGAGQFDNTATVSHGLGYRPFFSGYIYDGTNYYMNPINSISSFNYGIYVDTSNIYLYGTKYFYSAGNYTIYFYYNLFKNNTGI